MQVFLRIRSFAAPLSKHKLSHPRAKLMQSSALPNMSTNSNGSDSTSKTCWRTAAQIQYLLTLILLCPGVRVAPTPGRWPFPIVEPKFEEVGSKSTEFHLSAAARVLEQTATNMLNTTAQLDNPKVNENMSTTSAQRQQPEL